MSVLSDATWRLPLDQRQGARWRQFHRANASYLWAGDARIRCFLNTGDVYTIYNQDVLNMTVERMAMWLDEYEKGVIV